MTERLGHMLLRHLRGYPEMQCNFAVGEFLREAQLHRSAALRPQLPEHDAQPCSALRRVQVAVECGHRLEMGMGRSLVNVDAIREPSPEHRMLLDEIVGDRIEV